MTGLFFFLLSGKECRSEMTIKSSAPPPDWQENTAANPFWRCETRVEVELIDGKTRVVSCPKCARAMMPHVTRWRKSDQ